MERAARELPFAFIFKASPPKLIKLCFCTSLIQPWGQSHHIPSNSRKTSLWAFLPLLSYSVKYFLFPFGNPTVVCSLKYDLSSWDTGSRNIHHVYPKFSHVSGRCDWFRNTYLNQDESVRIFPRIFLGDQKKKIFSWGWCAFEIRSEM